MLSALIGKKIGMTQLYDAKGEVQPVTVVQAGPCSVLQIKTPEADGYNAVQIGFGEVKPQRTTKALIGHAVKAGSAPKKCIREYRLADAAGDVAVGQVLTVEVFEGVGLVDVCGTSKGKGTAGVMKRHHFKGMPASHGTERKHRSPGSIAAHATNRGWGGDIKKGKRMGGRMGNAQRTTRNHTLVAIDKENNLLLIKGAVPGANGGFVFIYPSKTAAAKSK
ncbi:MAG: 50S ribosomal protein L3 [Phycisphaerae bacterium]|jgi:large subunit ribosomal protein L3